MCPTLQRSSESLESVFHITVRFKGSVISWFGIVLAFCNILLDSFSILLSYFPFWLEIFIILMTVFHTNDIGFAYIISYGEHLFFFF